MTSDKSATILVETNTGTTMWKQPTIMLSLLCLISGCSNRNTPQNVAEDFIHNYYQRANQEAALRLSDSLAADKLRDELQLVRTVRRPGDVPSEMPEILFELLTQKETNENQVFFNYQLTIKHSRSSSSVRNVVIIGELIDGHWKVINFDEYDE